MGLLLLGSPCTDQTTGCVLSLVRGSGKCCWTQRPVFVKEMPVCHKGLWENMWCFIGIPHAGIQRILIVENCDLFSIKPHRGLEFWGADIRKHFKENLEINFLSLLALLGTCNLWLQVTLPPHHSSHSIDRETTWRTAISLWEDFALLQVLICATALVGSNKSSLEVVLLTYLFLSGFVLLL